MNPLIPLGGVLALATGAAPVADLDSLEKLWSGVHDSSEQVVVSSETGITSWPESSERRVRAIVEPVTVPWLGSHVLYYEEFLHDDPDNLRRQLLVKLEPAEPPAHGIRAHLYTFTKPRAWIHLNLRPNLLTSLGSDDIATNSACDLLFTREGAQFRGTTNGHRCLDVHGQTTRYLDYQVLVGQDLYWYRRRLLRRGDADVQEELIGFNWFELTLHSDDWPFAVERDALILVIQEQGRDVPLATAWSSVDEADVRLELSGLRVRCGPVVPELDDLQARLSDEPVAPTSGYPSPAPG